MMRGDGGVKDQKLTEEAGGERNTSQRSHRHQHGEGQERRTLRQAGKTFQLISCGLTNENQDSEAQQSHQKVSDEIKGNGAPRK